MKVGVGWRQAARGGGRSARGEAHQPTPAVPPAPRPGNALDWALRQVDASLERAETAPPPGARALLDAARGPAGRAAAAGAAAAARGVAAAGGAAVKAALPVGKWALGAGVKAAAALARRAAEKKTKG